MSQRTVTSLEMAEHRGRSYVVGYIRLPHGRGDLGRGRDLAEHTAHKNMPAVTYVHLTLRPKVHTLPPNNCEPINKLIPRLYRGLQDSIHSQLFDVQSREQTFSIGTR